MFAEFELIPSIKPQSKPAAEDQYKKQTKAEDEPEIKVRLFFNLIFTEFTKLKLKFDERKLKLKSEGKLRME